MYKTPKFYGPQLLYQMVKVHFYFFIWKVLLLESYHKIMKAFPWIFRIYRSIFKLVYEFRRRYCNGRIRHVVATTCKYIPSHDLSLDLVAVYLQPIQRQTDLLLHFQWWPSVRPAARICRERRPTSSGPLRRCSTSRQTLHRTGLKHGTDLLKCVFRLLRPAMNKRTVQIGLGMLLLLDKFVSDH